ncbi:type VII secretion system-associated protein [Nocardia sp. SC052]|uniref:type VII secretion system-associated protein n=1 Tax=Nocardia sichangensis TaxID=3385975 RepID=UPI00399FA4E5
MGETSPDAGESAGWIALTDPRLQPADSSEPTPPEAIVGGWVLNEDGSPGLFEPNPSYMPADGSPSDPVDAVLRLVAAGADAAGEIVPAIHGALVEIGCDDDDQPLIGRDPDGVACVVVVTAAVHKYGLDVERWALVPGALLPNIVPPGVDIMLNPAGPAAMRLRTDALTQQDQR